MAGCQDGAPGAGAEVGGFVDPVGSTVAGGDRVSSGSVLVPGDCAWEPAGAEVSVSGVACDPD